LNSRIKDQMKKFNRFQKNHLMKLHYWLNPLALCAVVLHWILSHCRSSSLPELGLSLVLTLVGLGLVMKFKIAPVSMRKVIYQIHTNPVLSFSIVSILLIGHSIVD
jgi:hypothetical protein